MSQSNRPSPTDIAAYVDWLNEEKVSERKTLITFLATLATALLAFTVSFRKDVAGTGPSYLQFLLAHWLFLLGSVFSAVIYHFLEVRFLFYQRLRKVQDQIPWTHYAGKAERALMTFVVFATPLLFLAGLTCLTLFVFLNTR